MEESKTFEIEFVGEKTIRIAKGETILRAAIKAGIPHYHSCGGHARCSTCRIIINRGKENLSEINKYEAGLREQLPLPYNTRLACQTFVAKGDVSIHRIIRDDTDVNLYIDHTEINFEELGEEKEMLLLFLDIRDFTPFMEKFLPFDVIHILRKLFSLFKSCIETGGGKIIETAGDGLYAIFYVTDSMETTAKNAIESAYAIFKDIDRFNREYVQKHFKHEFKIGIGLHGGKVIVGNVGLGINNNLTVMGLPVIIAARIQAATKDLNNSFLISEEVAKLAENKGHRTTLLFMKGVKDPIHVYLLGEPYYPSSLL